jgi:methylase of polypeptide subunit release factors
VLEGPRACGVGATRGEVLHVALLGPGACCRESRQSVRLGAVLRERDLEQLLELEHRTLPWLAQPRGKGAAALGSDAVYRPRPPPDARFLHAAAIADTDRVLDVGWGTGSTTRAVACRASSGLAIGVDLSSQMIQVARRTAAAEGVLYARF